MKTDDTHETFISRSILRDMSEGVLTLGLDGIVTFVNPAAEQILSLDAAKLVGKRFAASFFERPENDAFNQTVLDAIYDSTAYLCWAEAKQIDITKQGGSIKIERMRCHDKSVS